MSHKNSSSVPWKSWRPDEFLGQVFSNMHINGPKRIIKKPNIGLLMSSFCKTDPLLLATTQINTIFSYFRQISIGSSGWLDSYQCSSSSTTIKARPEHPQENCANHRKHIACIRRPFFVTFSVSRIIKNSCNCKTKISSKEMNKNCVSSINSSM